MPFESAVALNETRVCSAQVPASILVPNRERPDDRFGSFDTESVTSMLQCDSRCSSKTGHEFKALVWATIPQNLTDQDAHALEEMTTQRDALLTARFRGVRTVEIDGRRVTYASDTEMAAAITDLERRIALAGSEGRTSVMNNTRRDSTESLSRH
jgi:hypothetical protein